MKPLVALLLLLVAALQAWAEPPSRVVASSPNTIRAPQPKGALMAWALRVFRRHLGGRRVGPRSDEAGRGTRRHFVVTQKASGRIVHALSYRDPGHPQGDVNPSDDGWFNALALRFPRVAWGANLLI